MIAKNSILQSAYKFGLLAYVAVLPMSNTIALRNLLLLMLLSILIFAIVRRRNQSAIALSAALQQIPVVVMLWLGFLFLFPLWAVQHDVALENLKGQWIESVFAWIVGFGAVWLLGRNGPGLWSLALASMFSLVVHLLLVMAAWAGLLGSDFYLNPTIGSIGLELVRWFKTPATVTSGWQSFPIGFRGIEPMHGNLGYTASQAIALLAACFLVAWRDNQKGKMLGSLTAMAVCFLSILIASSRGAVFFGVLLLALAFLAYFIKISLSHHPLTGQQASSGRVLPGIATVSVIGLVLWVGYIVVAHDQRWHSMIDKIEIGFSIEEPLDLLCNGLTPEVEGRIRERFQSRLPAYTQDLIDGLKGQDGGRILLMRAGLKLMLENPWGLDGSRQSYQKLIEKKCGHRPALDFAHTHQSWIDLSLGLGWLGALLFGLLLFYFLYQAWGTSGQSMVLPWGAALYLISAFWVLRGFADSLYREHYLQMQALLLAYLFWRMRFAPECAEKAVVRY